MQREREEIRKITILQLQEITNSGKGHQERPKISDEGLLEKNKIYAHNQVSPRTSSAD